MGDAERMIPVAELLRREGVGAGEPPTKRGRVVATAAGVVALCGAAATGIIGFGSPFSTSLHLPDGDGTAEPEGSSEGGGVALGGGDRTSSADGASPFVRTSAQRSASRDDGERRVPAMTWLADDVAADRTTSTPWPTVDQDEPRGGAGVAGAERTSEATSYEERASEGTSPGKRDDGRGTDGGAGAGSQSDGSGRGAGNSDEGGSENSQRGEGGTDTKGGSDASGSGTDGKGGANEGAGDSGSTSGERDHASGGSQEPDQDSAEASDERGQSEERGDAPEKRDDDVRSTSPGHADS
ncbi:hypothetical protein [Haloechinothrix salitolerans]|uniref:Uncharacterized protein n=1 Tax=Haloechinothrix salitolerans TaxID=926830 RepID=A0ABW2C632_9PSEU